MRGDLAIALTVFTVVHVGEIVVHVVDFLLIPTDSVSDGRLESSTVRRRPLIEG